MTDNNRSFYEREDLLQQLDRHLDWIKSCDTKASIVLAAIGIFLTIFASDNSINMLNLVFSEALQNLNFSNILFLLFFMLSLCIFVYGTYSLIRVLVPRLSNEVQAYGGTYSDSLYFFEAISKNTFSEFKEKISKRIERDEINDIMSQIYINAKISTEKYRLYNKGIKFSFLGITGILILYVIGIVLLKSGGFS